MPLNDDLEPESFADLPESPTLRPLRPSRYGSVPGLDDAELADPAELQRQAFVEDWGPILRLPERHSRSTLRPAIDEHGNADWGAFASMDFRRLHGEFDKASYKADRLAEELRYSRIRFEGAMERVSAPAKHAVLDYVRRGVIEVDHIVDEDMQTAARWDARVRREQQEVHSLRRFSYERRHSRDE